MLIAHETIAKDPRRLECARARQQIVNIFGCKTRCFQFVGSSPTVKSMASKRNQPSKQVARCKDAMHDASGGERFSYTPINANERRGGRFDARKRRIAVCNLRFSAL